MDDGHAIDQEHQVATAVIQHRRTTSEDWLLDNLVTALTSCDFMTVIYFEADFFVKMEVVIGIITFDGYSLTIYEAVQTYRSAEFTNLVQNLVHLCPGEGRVIQSIDASVVFKQDICPVLNQILLGRVF